MEILSCRQLSNQYLEKFERWVSSWIMGEEEIFQLHQKPLNYYASLPKYIMMMEDDEIIGCVMVEGSTRERAVIQTFSASDDEVNDRLKTRAYEVCRKHGFTNIYVKQYNQEVLEQADGWQYTKELAQKTLHTDLSLQVADKKVFDELAKCYFSMEELSYEEAEMFIDKAMNMDDSLVVGIYLDKCLIGSSIIHLYQGQAKLRCFGIHPIFQGNGYGKKALQLIENHLYQVGYKGISKDVPSKNQYERKFYESLGFQQTTSYKFHKCV